MRFENVCYTYLGTVCAYAKAVLKNNAWNSLSLTLIKGFCNKQTNKNAKSYKTVLEWQNSHSCRTCVCDYLWPYSICVQIVVDGDGGRRFWLCIVVCITVVVIINESGIQSRRSTSTNICHCLPKKIGGQLLIDTLFFPNPKSQQFKRIQKNCGHTHTHGCCS